MVTLIRYEDYTRKDVHDIFAPASPFRASAGTWGIHGIVPVANRPGDFVLFVTFGQTASGHVFDEGVTASGVLSWQSQPRQGLRSPIVQQLIAHDEALNSIYLFLRTAKGRPYTFLGPKGLRLPVDSPRRLADGTMKRFVDWHAKQSKTA
jgi:hypothetical protein